MKLSLLTTLLPLAAAIPTNNLRPLDPVADSEIFRRHLDVLEAQRNGSLITPAVETDLSAADLEKRFVPFVALLGISLTGASRALSKNISKNLKRAFRIDDENTSIWLNDKHCRMYFQNVGGADCHLNVAPRGTFGASELNHWGNACSWPNAVADDKAGPPVFTGESAEIGKYTVQYTASDRAAWGGIPDTVKCSQEYLCNPQVVFYRDGYEIVLNTWQSQGRVSSCQYSGGEDCGGLCNLGRRNGDFAKAAMYAGDCAVPCMDEGLADVE